MNKKEYAEALQRPEWAARRLDILKRDGFKCVKCGAKKKMLHVHHLRYLDGKMPWESPDDDLVTLCNNCHAVEHDIKIQDQEKSKKKKKKKKKNKGMTTSVGMQKAIIGMITGIVYGCRKENYHALYDDVSRLCEKYKKPVKPQPTTFMNGYIRENGVITLTKPETGLYRQPDGPGSDAVLGKV